MRPARVAAAAARAVRAAVAAGARDLAERARDARTRSTGRFERRARAGSRVYERLEGITNAQLEHVDAIRNAVAYGDRHGRGADRPATRPGAGPRCSTRTRCSRSTRCTCARSCACSRATSRGAERFRRKAEVLALQATTRQMFASGVITELMVHATARDLTGVKQIMDRIPPLAGAERRLASVPAPRRGPLPPSARRPRRRARRVRTCALAVRPSSDPSAPDRGVAVGRGRVRRDPGRAGEYEQARAAGAAALERCRELDIALGAYEVDRALALAEGKLGDLDGAAARLRGADRRPAGARRHRPQPGHELRGARAHRDLGGRQPAVEHYGRLAAHEYRHGRNSPLGARYERLMHEARRAGIYALPELASLDASGVGTATLGGMRATETVVTEALSGADGRESRSAMALGLVCDAHGAGGGHLYLMGEDGLRWAATVAAEAHEGLDGLVTSFWNQRVEEPEMPTAFIAEGPGADGLEPVDRQPRHGLRARTDQLRRRRHLAPRRRRRVDSRLHQAAPRQRRRRNQHDRQVPGPVRRRPRRACLERIS